jgi:TetR/AcrR family transcriptional regulator, fatty acid biosynthesis regulator
MDAALGLLEGDSFSGISLREVTRAAGVSPAAFYRHFASMDELGLALVEESFRPLREMIRTVRSDPSRIEQVVRGSVEVLVSYVHAHRLQFRFIGRERFGGVPAIRQAIAAELRLFASELATDFSRFPVLSEWSTEDLQMIAGLFVDTMVSTAEAIIEVPPATPELERDVIRTAEQRLRLIALGAAEWRSES